MAILGLLAGTLKGFYKFKVERDSDEIRYYSSKFIHFFFFFFFSTREKQEQMFQNTLISLWSKVQLTKASSLVELQLLIS